jgi:uncharacterized membrane protein
MEAFSDGVIAIILTIMVLDLKAPASADLSALRPMIPTFLGYVLSFVHVGLYWNNHHHTLQAVRTVGGRVLLANMHLLFWMSLIPVTTNWMGTTNFAMWPVIVYGIVLLLSAVAYYILVRVLIRHEGYDSALARAIGRDWKGKISLAMYAVAIASAFLHPLIAGAIYAAVALMWLIPDSRIETKLPKES